jgi:hypothetical protein
MHRSIFVGFSFLSARNAVIISGHQPNDDLFTEDITLEKGHFQGEGACWNEEWRFLSLKSLPDWSSGARLDCHQSSHSHCAWR